MAVIITDMENPTNCGDCVFHRNYRCNDYGHISECCFDDDCREVNLLLQDRPEWCQLKSVDGLIECVKNNSYPVIYNTNNVDYGLTIKDIERVIKEYCGME